MALIAELQARYADSNEPFLISTGGALRPSDVLIADDVGKHVRPGDVVALVGDYDSKSISRLLTLFDANCTVMPLTEQTRPQHAYFLEAGHVDVYVDGETITRVRDTQSDHPMLAKLRDQGHAGLILFSSGTTGLPKAILHDFESFLVRFRTPRPAMRTLNFLLFDHIGGVNTLFHTLYNRGTVIFPRSRRVSDVIADINEFKAELLPTTPTFLRMILLSELLETHAMPTLKVVTYGTERMDEPTLTRICEALPNVDFRQTFGMSELGILRVKSDARDSLWMHVGGEGVETKVVDGVLMIRSKNRMVGYLNAPSPFDSDDWYDSKDLVDLRDDGAMRIKGRLTEWINIGGEKVLPETIEAAALEHDAVMHAKAAGVANPITGQHIELNVQVREGKELSSGELKKWLLTKLPTAFMPQRIRFGDVGMSHRFKKS
jgi:long-chain acyl-CoA synthetase